MFEVGSTGGWWAVIVSQLSGASEVQASKALQAGLPQHVWRLVALLPSLLPRGGTCNGAAAGECIA